MLEFPKQAKKKKRKKHLQSIMQKNDGTCFLCRVLKDDWTRKQTLHEHHIFGGVANRPISERYGLKVYLCLDHHVNGPEAVHNNQENMEILRRMGQRAFENNYPELNFKEIFGKNYWEE